MFPRTGLPTITAAALILVLTAGASQAGELHDAVQAGDAARVRELLASGADPGEAEPQAGFTPLHLCVYLGQLDLAPLLVEAGADLDARNPMGLSPLDLAVFVGNDQAVSFFVAQGAGLEGDGQSGPRPLAFAAGRGHAGIVELLLEGGARADAVNSEGETAVLVAAVAGHADVVSVLLDKGAPIDVTGRHGLTLLQRAAVAGHQDVVEMIVAAGADVQARTTGGETAHALALRYGHRQIAESLPSDGSASAATAAPRALAHPPSAGEAVAWYLANRGWAIRTRDHLLAMDAEDFGIVPPTEPGLANGFLVAGELGGQNMVGLYTCYHGEPGELSSAHELAGQMEKSAYVHLAADRFRDGPDCHYLEAGARVDVNGVDVQTLDASPGMPAHAYVLQVDDLRIFYQGFAVAEPAPLAAELQKAVDAGGPVDLAFLPIPEPGKDLAPLFALLEVLQPAAVCLLDPNRRTELFPALADEIRSSDLAGQVFAPRFPGDRLEFTGRR
ncbi:MAG: hypothetical protein GY838_00675 [bacterium]|nr:hypothetical protein [bacterium]